MSTDTKRTFIVIHKSMTKRLASSAMQMVFMVATIGVGVLLESTALQWTGAGVFLLMLFASGSGKLKEMTREQAIAYLESDEAK